MILVGRERELARLITLAEQAAAGRGGLVLLVGDAGIGKTRLAEELASRAAALGFTTRWARCRDDEGAPAYQAWGDLVSDKAAPADPDLEPAQRRFQLFETVTKLLRRSAEAQPVLFVFDDVHRADLPSLLLLHFVMKDLRAMRVLVAATYLPHQVEPDGHRRRLLDDLAVGAEMLNLGPLNADGTRELLGAVTGGPVPPQIESVVAQRSAGNPLFIVEFGRLLLTAPDQTAALKTIPETLRTLLGSRIDRLSEASRRLLIIAAVIGRHGDVAVAADATASSPREALDAFDEAAAAGLVRVDAMQQSYVFTHPLAREVLYDRLPSAERADLHLRVATAIESGTDVHEHVAELALHHLRSWPVGDPAKAVTYSRRAGRQAFARLAYEDAADHFTRALSAASRGRYDALDRAELLILLGEARLCAGDVPEAREAYEEAAELSRRNGWPEVLARAALGFGAGLGGFEVRLYDRSQIDLLEEALAALGPADSTLRAWTLARLSVALSFIASEQRRRTLSEEAVGMARRLADPAVLAYALAAHCDAIAGPAHVEQRLAESSEIIRLAQLGGERGTELLGRRLRVVALLELGEIGRVDAEIEAYGRTADALRQPLYGWYVPLWRGMRAHLDGRLADAERLAAEAAAIGERAHSENAAMSARGLEEAVAADRGDVTRALGLLDAMTGEGLPLGPSAEAFRVNFLARRGQLAAARAGVARLVAGEFGQPREDAEWLNGSCQLAEAVALVGDKDAAEVLHAVLEPYAHRSVVDGIGVVWFGSVAHYLGCLAHAAGDPAAASAYFDRALAAHRRAGAPLLIARTLHAYAAVADGAQAETMRREADAINAELGLAAPLAPPRPEPDTFRLDGEFWTLAFGGVVARVKDTKGVRDIARLIRQPGREIHALDLYVGTNVGPTADTGEAIDQTARAAYRKRLADLEELIDEAEEFGDEARASAARAERDALIAELSAAYGLGGRARRTGDAAERARSAVSWRIRDALSRIEKAHPALGRHLRNSIRTGIFCSYQPEQPISWSL